MTEATLLMLVAVGIPTAFFIGWFLGCISTPRYTSDSLSELRKGFTDGYMYYEGEKKMPPYMKGKEI